MKLKKIFNPKSRTHLVSAGTMLTGVALVNLPALQGAIPGEAYGWALFGLGVVNQILRSVTTTAVDER